MTRNLLSSATESLAYVMAGKATVTIVSAKTGTRFTFRISKPSDDTGKVDYTKPLSFVSLLSGADNESNYSYLGIIRSGPAGHRYDHGRKSKISEGAPAAKAFAWTFANIARGNLPATVEVWHEGKCGRCGRLLTVPSSIAAGIGPECASKIQFAAAA